MLTQKFIAVFNANQPDWPRDDTALLLAKRQYNVRSFAEPSHENLVEAIGLQPNYCIFMVSEGCLYLKETIKIIRELSPATNIILYFDEYSQAILEAEHLNISGILISSDDSNELLACMDQISEGFRYLSQRVVDFFRSAGSRSPLPAGLSKQELKILKLLSAGKTDNILLARELYVSPHTIKNHKHNLVKKLGLTGVTSLYIFAASVIESQ